MVKAIGGNIFESKNVSRELLDKWDEWETAIEAFRNTPSLKEKRAIVSRHPEIVGEVTCEACKQILDSGDCL